MRNRAEAALAGGDRSGDHRKALEATIAEADQLIRTFNAILMISRLEGGLFGRADWAGIGPDGDQSPTWSSSTSRWPRRSASNWFPIRSKNAGPSSATANWFRPGRSPTSSTTPSNIARAIGEHPKVVVALGREGKAWRIDVADSKVRASPRATWRGLTERFVRLEHSRSQPGSGLGLSLAKGDHGIS